MNEDSNFRRQIKVRQWTEQEESLGTELNERVGIKVTLQRKFC